MPLTARLFALAAGFYMVTAAITPVDPPASRGIPGSSLNTFIVQVTEIDHDTIASTVGVVNQKAGPRVADAPNQPVPETSVTALDGHLVHASVSSIAATTNTTEDTNRTLHRRHVDGYRQIFAGTGERGRNVTDASIEGTGYLTYTVVPNSTYNVDACLSFCSSVPGCVFANLYYEFQNYLLDFVFHEQSNLKCAVYGDIHNATEKTNFGGQQSYKIPAPLTYVQESSGWATVTLADIEDPDGYKLVFGPTSGANNAPGYMGFSFIDKYDVAACAALCNARDPDPNGGSCQYFNIWRALVNGIPTTYTCSFYYLVTDESTAVNYGQGDLKVTLSRGYRRLSLVPDGGFEGYTCSDRSIFCYTSAYDNWIGASSENGTLDATIFSYGPYAHFGKGTGLLGSATGVDSLSGTLAPARPLATVAGRKYKITFFHSSAYSGPIWEQDAHVEVAWNGVNVAKVTPGYSRWKYYQLTVEGRGNDTLTFTGGSAPAWSFIDDVYVFAL